MDLVTCHQFCWDFYATLGDLLLIWGPLSGLDLSCLCLGFQERQFYLSGGFSEFVR